MEPKIAEIAARIKGLREIMEISPEEMAKWTGVTLDDYKQLEEGKTDFAFSFLFRCAEKFGIDMIELLTGENPHLLHYSVVRKGQGLPIKRREGFEYYHLAATFKNKYAEPFLVRAPYIKEAENEKIHLSTHEGQEFDYILSGSLKVEIDGHLEILNEGDSVIYDSSKGHGMVAVGGKDCVFLAIILKKQDRE